MRHAILLLTLLAGSATAVTLEGAILDYPHSLWRDPRFAVHLYPIGAEDISMPAAQGLTDRQEGPGGRMMLVYWVDDVLPGRYQLVLGGEGRLPLLVEEISIPDGRPRVRHDLRIPAPGSGRRLEVRFVDQATGRPVSLLGQLWHRMYPIETAMGDHLVFEGLPPGAYRIRLSPAAGVACPRFAWIALPEGPDDLVQEFRLGTVDRTVRRLDRLVPISGRFLLPEELAGRRLFVRTLIAAREPVPVGLDGSFDGLADGLDRIELVDEDGHIFDSRNVDHGGLLLVDRPNGGR